MPKSGCGNLSEKALKIDAFGRPFEFILPNRTKRYKTLAGSILTVFLAILVILYTAYKLQLLLSNDQVFLTVTSEENFSYESEEVSALSNSEHGFNIAVGLIDTTSLKLAKDYEQYGQIKVYML